MEGMKQAALSPISFPVLDTSVGVPEPAELVVLIVEDDPSLLSVLEFAFRREGWRVIAAATSVAAMTAVESKLDEVDVVLLDRMLPGMDGLLILRNIRRRSNVPVLMVTARGEEQDRIDGLELGADDYVVKPFILRELVARVRAAVRRSGSGQPVVPAQIQRGPLVIHPDQVRVLARGQEVQLKRREFNLLMTLVLEPGRVFSRQDLLERAWGAEGYVDSRTVDVHVAWLRKKLDEAGGLAHMIETVHRAGYRFVVPAITAAPPRSISDADPAMAGA